MKRPAVKYAFSFFYLKIIHIFAQDETKNNMEIRDINITRFDKNADGYNELVNYLMSNFTVMAIAGELARYMLKKPAVPTLSKPIAINKDEYDYLMNFFQKSFRPKGYRILGNNITEENRGRIAGVSLPRIKEIDE